MDIRKLFEEKFPVPEPLQWNNIDCYMVKQHWVPESLNESDFAIDRDFYNAKWEGFQAAHELLGKDAARFVFLENFVREKAAVWILPCGDKKTFVQIRWFGDEVTNFPTVEGGLREAIDAAIAAEGEG